MNKSYSQKNKEYEEKILSIYKERWNEGNGPSVRKSALLQAKMLCEAGFFSDALSIYKRLLKMDPKDIETKDRIEELRLNIH